jgi:2-methylcitrate dehydratase PrpD
MTAARDIADFAARLTLSDIPAEVRRAAALHFADAVGVGLAASAGAAQRKWFGAVAGHGSASCFTGGTGSPAEAAMLNGALIHSLEFDDTHVGSVIHGSAVAAPVALAMAEAEEATGADLLLGYVIAWEVMIRIGLAAPGVFQARGFQVTAVAGAIGAATAAGRLRGLDGDTIAHAIAIAGSQATGLLAFLEDGSSVKALNPGWAAHSGIMAAGLAAAGMTGPVSILEGPLGVMQCFAGTSDGLAPHIASLGQNWYLPDAAFKLYPCCHYIHPFLEATEQLIEDGLTAADVQAMTAFVAPGQAPLICEPWSRRQSPASGYDGKWGLAYCVALLLRSGGLDVASFETEPDADVVELARRIDWTPMEGSNFPAVFPARLSVTTRNGRTLCASVANVKGSPGRPVRESVVRAKFSDNAVRRMPEATGVNLFDLLTSIEEAPDLSDLKEILQHGPRASKVVNC